MLDLPRAKVAAVKTAPVFLHTAAVSMAVRTTHEMLTRLGLKTRVPRLGALLSGKY